MPIEREGEFLVARDLGRAPSIGIESDKLKACIAEAQAKKFEGVFGAPCFGFREDTLDVLVELPSLREVWFWDCTLKSVEGLYAIDGLEYCGVMKERPGIDFSRFPRLDSLVAHWNPKDSGLADSPIRRFHLWHYNSHSKSFAGLEIPTRARCLELNWVNPVSLAGLPPLFELHELGIHRSRNMKDLSLLPHLAPGLKKLIVTTSKQISSFSGIEDHPSLELAIVNGVRIRG